MGNGIELEETPGKSYKKQLATKKPAYKTYIKEDKMKTKLQQTLADHRAEIKKLRREIRTHRLLMKQARLTYKITKR